MAPPTGEWKAFGRPYVEGNKVLYEGKVLCDCFGTNLGGADEAAETIAGLLSHWLDKQDTIRERLTRFYGKAGEEESDG